LLGVVLASKIELDLVVIWSFILPLVVIARGTIIEQVV
jgi:hypothetical protein